MGKKKSDLKIVSVERSNMEQLEIKLHVADCMLPDKENNEEYRKDLEEYNRIKSKMA